MSQTRQIPPRAASHSQLHPAPRAPGNSSTVHISGTLRLRGENSLQASGSDPEGQTNRHVKWSEDVVDNEGMGKKSSKVCCIYHKPRPVGESSSESESSDSSSSDSDSDSEIDHRSDRTSRSRLAPDSADKLPQHSPDQSMQGGQETCCQAHRGVTRKERNPSPNAYEKLPKTTRRPTKIETSG